MKQFNIFHHIKIRLTAAIMIAKKCSDHCTIPFQSIRGARNLVYNELVIDHEQPIMTVHFTKHLTADPPQISVTKWIDRPKSALEAWKEQRCFI